MTEWKLAESVLPITRRPHLFETFPHTDASHPETGDCGTVWWQQIGESEGDGINLQIIRNLVDSDLDCTARIHRPMPSHRPRRRFVGPNPSTGVVEGADFVGSGVQYAVVVGRHMSERGEGTSVNQSVGLNPTQSPLIVGV